MSDMTIAQLYHWGSDTPDVDGVKYWKPDEIVQQQLHTESIRLAKDKWTKRIREAAGV